MLYLLLQIVPAAADSGYLDYFTKQGPVIGLLALAVWYFQKQNASAKADTKALQDKYESSLVDDREKLATLVANNNTALQNNNNMLQENIELMREIQGHLNAVK